MSENCHVFAGGRSPPSQTGAGARCSARYAGTFRTPTALETLP